MTIMAIMVKNGMVKNGKWEWETVGVADAKARLSELLERVGRGERIVVARRGKPVAVLAPPGAVAARDDETYGLATLAGAMSDWPTMESDMADVLRSRRSARERRVPDLR